MIIRSGDLYVLADTIAAVSIRGEQSSIYTTGGVIPCSRADAEYFAQRWQQWEEIEDEEEDEEDEEEEDE